MMATEKMRHAAVRWLAILPAVAAMACGGRSCGRSAPDGTQATAGTSSAPSPVPQWPDVDATPLLQQARQLLDTLPADSADIAETAAGLGNDVERIFSLVRDGFAFDPYRGGLRGARGTLMALSGNALDRSLLLAALLRAGGHSVRLARGTLDPEETARLLAHAARTGTLVPKPQAITEDSAAIARMAKEQAEVIRVGEAIAKRTTETVDARVQRSLDAISHALQSAGVVVSASVASADAVREHSWVQVKVGEDWRDLDSAFPEATVGRSFAAAAGSAVDPDNLPRESFQRIQLKVSVVNDGGAAETVLDREWTVPELLLKPISLGFTPKDTPDPTKAVEFQPSVLVGTVLTAGRIVVLGPKPTAGGSIVDAFGGGGDEPTSPSIRRIQLDMALHGPGMPTVRATRTLAEVSPTADPAEKMKNLRLQVNSVYQFFATAGPVPLDWVVRNQQTFLENLDKPGSKPPAFVSIDLLNLARVMVDGDARTGAARRYRPRPLVIGQRVGFRESAGRYTFVKSFDVLHNRTDFLSQDPMLPVRQGVFETELEREALAGGEVFNTSTVFERSTGPARVFRPGQEADLKALDLGPEVAALMADDLAAGYVTIVPPSRVQIGGRPTIGWWRVRPDGGETLGRMESGEGQSMTDMVITTILGGSFSGYSFLASTLCKTTGGITCNPCLIAAAGLVGTGIGLYGFAAGGAIHIAWRGVSVLIPSAVRYGAIAGLGAMGFKNKAMKCVDWLTVGALG